MKNQEPEKPYPYIEKEISFVSIINEIELHGTLTIPNSTGIFPAILLITGSGPQDRNEEILGHKPFLVLSDYLTRNGFIVFRYDDRHFGMNVIDGFKYTTEQFVDDANAALSVIFENNQVDKNFVGIIGHSEGGVIGAIIASKMTKLKFIINLAGNSLSGYSIGKDQQKKYSKNKKDYNFNIKTLDIIMNCQLENERKENILFEHKKYYGFLHYFKRKELLQSLDMMASNWNYYYLNYDPQDAWRNVNCNCLVLIGEFDTQVDPEENSEAFKKYIDCVNKSNEITIFPKVNHLFQTETHKFNGNYHQLLSSYAHNPETISEEVMKYILKWIQKIS